MQYIAHIKVMPHNGLLDPQGKAVLGGLKNLGMQGIKDVRIGKHIALEVEAASLEEAKGFAQMAAEKLLSNPVMEQFEIEVENK